MSDVIRMLVPLRSVDQPGKTRLNDCLDIATRRQLISAMFLDVVDTLRDSNLGDVVVLAGDRSAVHLARAAGCDFVCDLPAAAGLAEVITDGRRRAANAADALVVMPDLPTLTPAEVRVLASSAAPVAIAPTDDGGTGGLLLRRSVSMGLRFGVQSASWHAVACLHAGLVFEWCRLAGFAHDVDRLLDLASLAPDRLGLATSHLLSQEDEGTMLVHFLQNGADWSPPDRPVFSSARRPDPRG